MTRHLFQYGLIALCCAALEMVSLASDASAGSHASYMGVATNYWASTMAGISLTNLKPIVTRCYWESAGGPLAEADGDSIPYHPDGRFIATSFASHSSTGDLAVVVLAVVIDPSCLSAFVRPAEVTPPPQSRENLGALLATECGSQMDLRDRSSQTGTAVIVLKREAGKWLVHLEYVYQMTNNMAAGDVLTEIRKNIPETAR